MAKKMKCNPINIQDTSKFNKVLIKIQKDKSKLFIQSESRTKEPRVSKSVDYRHFEENSDEIQDRQYEVKVRLTNENYKLDNIESSPSKKKRRILNDHGDCNNSLDDILQKQYNVKVRLTKDNNQMTAIDLDEGNLRSPSTSKESKINKKKYRKLKSGDNADVNEMYRLSDDLNKEEFKSSCETSKTSREKHRKIKANESESCDKAPNERSNEKYHVQVRLKKSNKQLTATNMNEFLEDKYEYLSEGKHKASQLKRNTKSKKEKKRNAITNGNVADVEIQERIEPGRDRSCSPAQVVDGDISKTSQDHESPSLNLSSPGKEKSKLKRKRKHSVTDKDITPSRKLRVIVNNENYESLGDFREPPEDKEEEEIDETKQNIPQHLIELMHKLDLFILCSLRKTKHKEKYPSLSLTFGNSKANEFSDIVIQYEKTSVHVQIENVDKYYVENINYARLFTKEKISFSLNSYFDSFVKDLVSTGDDASDDRKQLLVYTNSRLDLTENMALKRGRFVMFYPFEFESINLKEYAFLKDFLYTKSKTKGSCFYQFSKEKAAKEEFLKRLEFSSAALKVVEEKGSSQEEVKESFLNKLVFAVSQPDREELSGIIKNEMEQSSEVQEDYMRLQGGMLKHLEKNESYKSDIIYGFNLLKSFLHDMFLQSKHFSINFEEKGYGVTNDIGIKYKNRITYVKGLETDGNIGYGHLFPPKRDERKKIPFSIEKLFCHFVDKLKGKIKYVLIFTNANLDLTDENELIKGKSRHFQPLKFDSIDVQKSEYKILQHWSFINVNRLYQFSQEDRTRELILSQLKLPASMQQEGISVENEKQIKESFLNKLIFATAQSKAEGLSATLSNDIEKSNVPYSHEELHEIALRWAESHEYRSISKELMEKLLEDVKNKRLTLQTVKNKNIDEEVKFAKSVVGREGTPAFNHFLDFLVKGNGVKCLKVLKNVGIDLANMSSILHVSGAGAVKVFTDLYCIWIDDQGNKTKYLKTLETEGINLSNMSSILGGSGLNSAKSFKGLYDLWFDANGNKTHYLKTLETEGINLTNMSSILSGAGASSPRAFEDLFDSWFDKEGNKAHYLTTLEKQGLNLSNISGILNLAGGNAAKAFQDLCNLWFTEQYNKPNYLKTLEKENISLTNISSILSGAGANASKAFKELYDLWFDKHGNKTRYLETLEKEGINLTNVSSILCGAGAHSAKAFKSLFDSWFDEKGDMKPHLKHFIENKDESKSFTLHNLSGILSRAGGRVKEAFEKLHDVCFDEAGNRTQLLSDFYKADFVPSNLSCTLWGTGVRASLTLKRFHKVCFSRNKGKTKYVEDFCKAGFRPCDLCGILTAAAEKLEMFHKFCFSKDTKKYLNHFLVEEGFKPSHLSKIFHGAGANICVVLKEFHDICFDEKGKRKQILEDFYKKGFTPNDVANVLSLAGNNATSILRSFHESCFSKSNYLDHFLGEVELFSPKVLCNKILYGIGTNTHATFERLHNLCFDMSGNRTEYLENLLENYPPDKVTSKLYKKCRKGRSALSDDALNEIATEWEDPMNDDGDGLL